jgi:beta-glucosidase
MGEDPYLASVMCVPYIQAVQRNGVATCVKHFALNNQEKWRGHINVEVSDRALHEIYLPAFKAAVEQGGAWSLMGAYNQVRGEHACHNHLLLNKILKGDWQFDGVVISDWGGTHDTRQAALNGLDIEMATFVDGVTFDGEAAPYEDYYLARPYLTLLRNGELPMRTLDDKATRILRLIFRTAMNRNKPYGTLCTEAHYAVAREIGDEGIVLLKNAPAAKKAAPLLPLAPGKRILVVGDNATRMLNQGGGSSELKAKEMVSPLDGLCARYGNGTSGDTRYGNSTSGDTRYAGSIAYTQGYAVGAPLSDNAAGDPHSDNAGKSSPALSDSLRNAAVAQAREADIVVLFGGLNKGLYQDCEGDDRRAYGLPFGQPELIEALLAVNKNLVLVLLSGNAVELPAVDRIPAIVQGWYLGSMGGKSLADVLSGDVNPSGKLPFSFPVKLTDCSAHAFDTLTYPGDGTKEEYKEDILVGYRWHDVQKTPALFPFGHGLSYTTFTYSKPVLSAKTMTADGTLTLSLTVRNSGSVAGKEVVQLYVGDERCRVTRPVKELKHFTKLALAPGEEKQVTFTLTPDDLRFYDEAAGNWAVEAGKFNLYVGASSTDIRGKASFELK